jgi:hypothetical protein
MQITLPLDKMSVEEKLRLMDEIWADLLKNEDQIPIPEWHLDILREREQMVAEGKMSYVPWEQAKQELDAMIRKREGRDPSAGAT